MERPPSTSEDPAGDLLARIGNGLPRWPAEEIQKKYTGTSGLPLMRSTVRFVEALEADGAFATPGWQGLDYGCGWGRIASVLLTKGAASQLDLCDAWPRTIDILKEAGFSNRIFAVSEVMADREIPEGSYDLIYAYSVFTHLRRDAFESNIGVLQRALRKGGRFYFTVRHADYMTRIKADAPDFDDLHAHGFWYRPTGNSIYFGTAVPTREYVEKLPRTGSIEYLGEVDACQHLYVIRA
jgi:SAM-dependent methyltransferase